MGCGRHGVSDEVLVGSMTLPSLPAPSFGCCYNTCPFSLGGPSVLPSLDKKSLPPKSPTWLGIIMSNAVTHY